MRKCAVFLAVAVVVAGLSASAFGATTMALTRTTTGLDGNGWFIPGTTQLTFTVTMELGGDMENVTALAVEETLPAGWTFVGGTPSGSSPNLFPNAGASGTGNFVWFAIPAFPASFTYSVNVPSTMTEPLTLTGLCRFRTSGAELQSNRVDTVIQTEPTTIVASRSLAGTVGPGGLYYTAGTTVDVTMQFTRTGTDTLTAFAFEDNMPATGWNLVSGSVAGSSPPNLSQQTGNQIAFVWFAVPTFPLTLTYQITIPSDAAGEKCLNGLARFRTSGAEMQSNTVQTCLNELPCLTLDRVIPTTCYQAGTNLTVNITMTNACPSNLTALGLEETLPAGWTFVSATAGDIKPAAGASGKISFAWFSIPTFPLSFSYVVSVPASQEGDVTISGQALFRLTGAELRTFVVDTLVCGADLVKPVITLIGDAAVTIECGSVYEDAGAEASDNVDGDITANIVTVNPVNPAVPDTYTITYNVSDAAGNAADEVTRTVTVQDTTAPTLALLGDAAIALECGTAFVDPGVTATDVCDGDLANSVVINGAVNSSVPGEYTLTYDVNDSAGNPAAPVQRVVTVSDTLAPVISVVGGDVTVECGTQYVDAGATAADVCSGSIAVVTNNPVDAASPGVYTVTYTAQDAAGNPAQAQRTVTVQDTTPPVVTLIGQASITLNINDPYTDAGVNATDTCDTEVDLVTDNPVTTAVPGVYTVRYTATDNAGLSTIATRTVTVVDNIPPVLTLTGGDVQVECHSVYTDQGATASDNVDGDITSRIVVDNQVNVNAVGVYGVTYNVTDAAGNSAVPITRSVNVVDTTVPVLSLLGDPAVTVECGGNYTDAGATAADGCAGDLTGSIVVDNPVNTAVAGTYTITYSVSDPSGNAAAPITRTVTVSDTIAPVLTVNGDSPMMVQCGAAYAEPGATAVDVCDGILAVTVGGDTVDATTPGTYVVTYDAQDAAGNPASAARTVNVVDTTAPVVTVTGSQVVNVDCNGVYTEQGATAGDVCSGDLTDSILITGSVDTSTPGQYVITYSVTDAAGNDGVARRTVVVAECPTEGETTPCDDCPLTIAIASPAGNIAVPVGANALVNLASAVTFANAECATHRTQVVYSIDGTPVGVSSDRASGYAATTTLIARMNAYVLTATVKDIETGCEAVAMNEFVVAPGTDDDGNGLPDNPFMQLPGDGDRWDAVVAGANCPRAISMISWTNPVGADVVLVVTRPDDATQSVTVTIPRGLIGAGEHGIAVVSISCDIISLLGAVEAAKVAAEPENLVAGGAPFQVSIIVSGDGGATFNELNNLTAPVGLSLNGLAFSPNLNATFFDHPSDVTKDNSDRVQITVPAGGSWSSANVDNPVSAAGTLSAETTSLSVFEPFEVSPMGPTLSVSPNPAYDFIVGIVQVNGSVTNVLKVKNIGGGTLTGTAALNDPSGAFSIVGAANYSLTFGQTAVITVAFKPTKTGDFTAALTFSNTAVTPNRQVVATLRGTGSAKAKTVSIFGCSPSSTSGGGMGDLAVMGIALAGLLALSRVYRRSHQS